MTETYTTAHNTAASSSYYYTIDYTPLDQTITTENTVNFTSPMDFNVTTPQVVLPENANQGLKNQLEYVRFVIFAIVLWSGLIGNVLAIVCLVTSKALRKTTTGQYLIALAVADSIFLIGDILRWLNFYVEDKPLLGIKFYDNYNFWCKTIFFLRYYGKLVSAWITIAITLERYISVSYPLKAGQISTKTTTRITITSIFIICAALTSYPYWTIGLFVGEVKGYSGVYKYCTYLKVDQYVTWNYVVLWAGSLFLPSIILAVFTSLIIIKLTQMRKARESLTGDNKMNKVEKQLTVMLVVVAMAFLCLRLPYTVSYYLFEFRELVWNPITDSQYLRIWIAKKFTDILATSNYGTNFYLYCISGSAFRSQFLSLICCCRKKGSDVKKSRRNTVSTSLAT